MKRLGFIIMFLLFCHAVVQASQEGDDNVQDVMFGKALECYNLAISGDPEAQYQLATCYHGGYGVEENDSLAFAIYARVVLCQRRRGDQRFE